MARFFITPTVHYTTCPPPSPCLFALALWGSRWVNKAGSDAEGASHHPTCLYPLSQPMGHCSLWGVEHSPDICRLHVPVRQLHMKGLQVWVFMKHTPSCQDMLITSCLSSTTTAAAPRTADTITVDTARARLPLPVHQPVHSLPLKTITFTPKAATTSTPTT